MEIKDTHLSVFYFFCFWEIREIREIRETP